jgi:hypothetical protein
VEWSPDNLVAAIDRLIEERRDKNYFPCEITLTRAGKALFAQSRRRKLGPRGSKL